MPNVQFDLECRPFISTIGSADRQIEPLMLLLPLAVLLHLALLFGSSIRSGGA